MAEPIVGLLQVASSLLNLGSSIVSTTDTTKRNAQLLEFQQALIGLNAHVLSVQQQNTTLLNQKNDAEAELKSMKDWGAEKQRYQLVRPYTGVPAYALKKTMSNGEAAHYLCANCFQSGKRSFLQHGNDKHGFVTLACAACRFEGLTEWRGVGPDKYAEEIAQTE